MDAISGFSSGESFALCACRNHSLDAFRTINPNAHPTDGMAADLEEKTDRYERLLAEALDVATVAPPPESPLGNSAMEFETMAQAYLEDGRQFRENDDLVNALAAFSYGHAWLDAGARIGVFDVPTDGHLFTV